MFDINFAELAVIGVVALVVVGPKKLPELARTAGRWVGKARRMIASARADMDREFKTDELRKLLTEQQGEMAELRQIITETRTGLEADFNKASAGLEDNAIAPTSPPALTEGAKPALAAADPATTTPPPHDRTG